MRLLGVLNTACTTLLKMNTYEKIGVIPCNIPEKCSDF